MKVLLITAAILFAQENRPAQQPGQPGARPTQPGAQPGQPGQPAAHGTIDGSWTVVDIERHGREANEMKNKTVQIRDNVLVFDDAARPGQPGQPGATAGKSDLKPMRLEFAPEGKIRVTELPAGTRPGQPGAQPGQPGAQPGQPGAAAGQAKTGVYAATQEYLVISITNDDGASRPGTRPQPAPPGTRPQPGQPGAAQGKPELDNPLTIVLKKNGHGEQPGARPGQPRPGQPQK